MAELALQREMGWAQKDLRALTAVKDLYITLGDPDQLIETSYANVRNFLFQHPRVYPPIRNAFDEILSNAKARLPGHVPAFIELVKLILQLRQQLLLLKKPHPSMRQDLAALIRPRFLESVPFPRLQQFPRYLKSMLMRAERAEVNPAKDQEKARQIAVYTQHCNKLAARKDLSGPQMEALEEFRWLIEELKVSLYAQELGTSVPISPKRLDKFLDEQMLK
jgi:ATP-dependent helicase HrpA